MKPWHEDFQKDKIEQVPVWVQLPDLELKYWSAIALSTLTSLLGTPIMADKNTQEKNKVHYARVLIEVKIQEQVPKQIYLENENGILMQQEVVFEWEPVKCGKCKGFGHETSNYRKGVHWEWRPKTNPPP